MKFNIIKAVGMFLILLVFFTSTMLGLKTIFTGYSLFISYLALCIGSVLFSYENK